MRISIEYPQFIPLIADNDPISLILLDEKTVLVYLTNG